MLASLPVRNVCSCCTQLSGVLAAPNEHKQPLCHCFSVLRLMWLHVIQLWCMALQILERTVSIHTMKDGNMDECLLEEVVAYRQFTMQEVDLLATLTGMEVRRMAQVINVMV